MQQKPYKVDINECDMQRWVEKYGRKPVFLHITAAGWAWLGIIAADLLVLALLTWGVSKCL
jgi:hypothetical protein